MNKFSKVAGCKFNMQKSFTFLYFYSISQTENYFIYNIIKIIKYLGIKQRDKGVVNGKI